jgi:hypothetical protein
MDTLKVKFKLNGLEFELEGNESTVKEELGIFKEFVMNNLINKLTSSSLAQAPLLSGGNPSENNFEEISDYPALKEIVMMDLPKSEVEWICVYSFYASNYGKASFKDSDIKDLYESSKRKNDSRMANFSGNFGKVLSNGWIRVLNDEEYITTKKGNEEAIRIFKKISDDDSEAATSKPSAKIKKTKNKTASKSTFSLVNTLNLNPSNEKSLKEFFAEFLSKTFFEKNLLFIYYIEHILHIGGIGINHVYTCYKSVGEKVPGNLYQSLVDTKNLKGWIESKDINNLKITIAGENYVEHDFKKVEIK